MFDFKITKQEEGGKDGTVYYIHLDASSGSVEDHLTLPAGDYLVEELSNINYGFKSVTVNDKTEMPDAKNQITVTVGGADNGEVTVTYTNNHTPQQNPQRQRRYPEPPGLG